MEQRLKGRDIVKERQGQDKGTWTETGTDRDKARVTGLGTGIEGQGIGNRKTEGQEPRENDKDS